MALIYHNAHIYNKDIECELKGLRVSQVHNRINVLTFISYSINYIKELPPLQHHKLG